MSIITFSLIITILSFGCEKDDCPLPESPFETKVFKATFHTYLSSLAPDSINCSSPRTHLNVQVGNGTEATVGDFDVRITFCVDVSNFKYGDTDGVMTSSNGDKLYLDVSGQVVPTTKDGYDLEFKDPFTIIGGTGKFAGATGSGITESYVNMTTGRTDHTWNGTITLVK